MMGTLPPFVEDSTVGIDEEGILVPTLEEIAELTGVSRSTVSRVVNNDSRVSPATREKVWEAIQRQGYRPNLHARGLAAGRSNIVAAVIPGGISNILADPYFGVLLSGIASAADSRDRYVLLSLSDVDFKHRVDELAQQGAVDGVIFSSSEEDEPLTRAFLNSGTPFVSVGRNRDGRVSYVDIDNRAAARQITAHLLRLGRRRVATITGALVATAAQDRLEGYRDALEAFGLPIREELIVEGDFTETGGRIGMRNLLECQPDAVFAASDRMAAGALNEIRANGLRVPEDVAVVGFDDIPLAAEMNPPLTTIRQSVKRLGETALEVLLDLIDVPAGPPRRVVVPTELVVRASCGSNLETERKE
jgi:LacI family transcriptional regulator